MMYRVFCVRWDTFFLVNRVEHQKLNQTTPYTVFSVSWNKLDVEHQSVEKLFDLEVDFGGAT